MARTIQSPGVEIKEVDLSLRPQLPVGTTVFATGFSPQGPTDEVLEVASLSEFEQIYGKPSNAAERYFYHTVRGIFQSPANVLVSRMPYGSGGGDLSADKYSALLYPVIALSGTADYTVNPNLDVALLSAGVASHHLSACDAYIFGQPYHKELNEAEYNTIRDGNFTWEKVVGTCANTDLNSDSNYSKAGMIVLNKRKFSINEKYEGYYIGVTDNTNLNPATDFDGILNLKTVNKNTYSAANVLNYKTTQYVTAPEARLTFPLSATSSRGEFALEGSVSEVMENASVFDLSTDEFSDSISLGVFKVRQSTLDPDTNKLDYVLTETYTGSLNYFRQQFKQDGGNATSFFLEAESTGSPNLDILVNEHISKSGGDWLDANGNPTKKVRFTTNKVYTNSDAYLNSTEQIQLSGVYRQLELLRAMSQPDEAVESALVAENLYPHGSFKETSTITKELGSIPGKLDRIFELVDNHELFPIDITVDGGLSTIYTGSLSGTANFDDEQYLNIGSVLDSTGLYQTKLIGTDDTVVGDHLANYRTITNRFVDFAQNKRKDNIFVSDALRYIFVQGSNNRVLSDKNKNFSQHVYWPLKNTYATNNTSYAASYANWVKVYDDILNKQIWVPMSGRIAAMYANTDSNFQPWIAPAGFTRGVLTTVNDLALYPKQKHRDQLYKIKMNPVANFPNDGFVVFGQKTLQTKPSAFDRVNVRRLFLYLEKATRATCKYFVFEPNTLFTRTQVVNVLTPIFENAKNTQGVYDYLIICDERNNTPDVIDQNELVVDIYLKPVRAAEFILVNFYATRTGQDFSELIA